MRCGRLHLIFVAEESIRRRYTLDRCPSEKVYLILAAPVMSPCLL